MLADIKVLYSGLYSESNKIMDSLSESDDKKSQLIPRHLASPSHHIDRCPRVDYTITRACAIYTAGRLARTSAGRTKELVKAFTQKDCSYGPLTVQQQYFMSIRHGYDHTSFSMTG